MTLEKMKIRLKDHGQIGCYVFHRVPLGLEQMNRAVRDRDVWNIYFQSPGSVPPNVTLESLKLDKLVDKLEKEGFPDHGVADSLYFVAILQAVRQSGDCVWILSEKLFPSPWLQGFIAGAIQIQSAA